MKNESAEAHAYYKDLRDSGKTDNLRLSYFAAFLKAKLFYHCWKVKTYSLKDSVKSVND